jgi:RNA polymerase sigma-70 factor (ECF subfamily)
VEKPVQNIEDHRRVEAYLQGADAAAMEVDGWVRREIEICYPVLRRDLEDVCQVVHGKVLDNLRRGRFQYRSTLKTYIGRIAHNTAIDFIRERYRDRTVSEGHFLETSSSGENPYKIMASLEKHKLIHQVLLQSPASCRDLWRMVFMERLSYDKISQRLGIPEGTVKSRVWHCRRKALALLASLRRKSAGRPDRQPSE